MYFLSRVLKDDADVCCLNYYSDGIHCKGKDKKAVQITFYFLKYLQIEIQT